MSRISNTIRACKAYLLQPSSIAPLIVLRMVFGALMFAATIRFFMKGWISSLYIKPDFHFSYYGFQWLEPLPGWGMYAVFILIALAALGITTGAFYRISAALFFLSFTYVELLDKTTYLNHYYFVSLVSFLLIFVPAQRRFSIDVLRKPSIHLYKVPRWTILIFIFQLSLVYFYAGVAKLNYDWLIRAQPLKIWLTANSDLPLIGRYLDETWAHYAFSWGGALYDLTIPFFLLNRHTRIPAYVAVIGFHMMTLFLFPIGMFPYIMIGCTLIFFSASFHEKILGFLRQFLPSLPAGSVPSEDSHPVRTSKVAGILLGIFIAWQLLMPWRYLLYPGNLFWTQEGYRFSWRVMLMEKAGTTWFYVKDSKTGNEVIVHPKDYLTPFQNKMMAMQPDFILEFAHYLEKIYCNKGFHNPEVRAKSYVTLNGRLSKQYINPQTDLTTKERGFHHKDWILPYPYETP